MAYGKNPFEEAYTHQGASIKLSAMSGRIDFPRDGYLCALSHSRRTTRTRHVHTRTHDTHKHDTHAHTRCVRCTHPVYILVCRHHSEELQSLVRRLMHKNMDERPYIDEVIHSVERMLSA
jgi:hypothetical protein